MPATRTEYTTLAGNANIGMSVTTSNAPGAPVGAGPVVLDQFVKELATRLNSTVTSTTAVDVNSAPGLDYVIDIKGMGQNRGRVVAVGARVFNMYVVAVEPDLVDLERVTASFVPA